jgi:Fe-S cluster assembly ATPase SufC
MQCGQRSGVFDYVHVLYEGRIIRSGPKELALELEEKGYDWLKEGELVKS